MNDESIHERLRQILREGDPAVQESGLTQDEVHAMRRTVLTAIPESRRRLAWLPLLTAGTAALILLALVFALGPWHRSPLATPPAPRVAAVPSPAPVPPSPPTPAVIPSPEQRPKPSRRRAVRPPQPPPARHDEPMTLASLPDTPDSSIREIRFSTAGGTRVIWQMSVNDSR